MVENKESDMKAIFNQLSEQNKDTIMLTARRMKATQVSSTLSCKPSQHIEAVTNRTRDDTGRDIPL